MSRILKSLTESIPFYKFERRNKGKENENFEILKEEDKEKKKIRKVEEK